MEGLIYTLLPMHQSNENGISLLKKTEKKKKTKQVKAKGGGKK